MKILRPILAGLVLCLLQSTGSAQTDTAKLAQKALFFADSLVKTEKYESWSAYTNLVIPSVVKYYGGKDGFIEHVQKGRAHLVSTLEEDAPTLKLLHLLQTQNGEWQCVIQESRYIHRDDKKLHITTYFVGQSKDEGENWRLFDVGYNKVANIIYMMPDVYGDLPIPEHTIISTDEELAAEAAAAKPPAPAKKTVSKKK